MWQKLKAGALEAKRAARPKDGLVDIFGSDISGDMLEKARARI